MPDDLSHTALPPLPTLYLPFEEGPFRMAMGLTVAPEEDWLEIDTDYAPQIALRAELLATRRQAVFAAGADTRDGRQELLETLASHLLRRYPSWFVQDGAMLACRLTGQSWNIAAPGEDPFIAVGHLAAEDFVLLRDSPEGPVFDSAVLCFPSRWRLSEKIGKLLLPVHEGVPFYASQLGRPVNRFLTLLKPGRIALRLNWSVMDDPTLFQPSGHGLTGTNPSITPENAGSALFLRVERQTFRRLPRSGTVAFGVHMHVSPLSAVAAVPGEAARLATAIRALPPEMQRYKSLQRFRTALLAYLDAA